MRPFPPFHARSLDRAAMRKSASDAPQIDKTRPIWPSINRLAGAAPAARDAGHGAGPVHPRHSRPVRASLQGKNMRLRSSLPSLALAAAFACGATGAARAADETPVRIGFAAPLTGVNAGYGKDLQNGVQLALDDARAQRSRSPASPRASNSSSRTTRPIRGSACRPRRASSTRRCRSSSATSTPARRFRRRSSTTRRASPSSIRPRRIPSSRRAGSRTCSW